MSLKTSQHISAALLASALCFHAADSFGSGFAVYTQDASALGQGNAMIAHTDGPAAIFFNPALLNKLEGTQVEVGTTLIFPSRKSKSDLSSTEYETEYSVFYPSTFYISHRFDDKVSAGLGVFSPFGLGTDWGEDWEGRYITTRSEMKTFNFNPAISYQIMPNLSVAAGVDFILLDATLENKVNLFSGDGRGLGYNLGAVYDINEDTTLGASYRSEVNVDIAGDATFIPAAFYTKAETDITLPQQVHAGISYKGFEDLIIEAGVRWEGWSSYDELKLDFEQSIPIIGITTMTYEKDWKDTWTGNAGAQYQLNDSVSLRAGYLYGGNPVPDKTFEPSIPDSNTHIFTIGTGLKYQRIKIDLAYAYQMQESREKNNTIDDSPLDGLTPATSANGRYDSRIHLVGINLTYIY
ncbi:MAG TPA: OmpP1/FadL family transporter [Nitrospirota bacterium]|nr:OmpP1/FadL family transporter [Nitrospirota bacterium]